MKTVSVAQINTKDPFVSTKIDPVERVYIKDIPLDTFAALKDLKARLRAKTWLELLALLATADIKPQGSGQPVTDGTQPEAAP